MPDMTIEHVFAVGEIAGVSLIDGGDTVALRLRETGGREFVVLAPLGAARDLRRHLEDVLANVVVWPRNHRVPMETVGRDGVTAPALGDGPILGTFAP